MSGDSNEIEENWGSMYLGLLSLYHSNDGVLPRPVHREYDSGLIAASKRGFATMSDPFFQITYTGRRLMQNVRSYQDFEESLKINEQINLQELISQPHDSKNTSNKTAKTLSDVLDEMFLLMIKIKPHYRFRKYQRIDEEFGMGLKSAIDMKFIEQENDFIYLSSVGKMLINGNSNLQAIKQVFAQYRPNPQKDIGTRIYAFKNLIRNDWLTYLIEEIDKGLCVVAMDQDPEEYKSVLTFGKNNGMISQNGNDCYKITSEGMKLINKGWTFNQYLEIKSLQELSSGGNHINNHGGIVTIGDGSSVTTQDFSSNNDLHHHPNTQQITPQITKATLGTWLLKILKSTWGIIVLIMIAILGSAGAVYLVQAINNSVHHRGFHPDF